MTIITKLFEHEVSMKAIISTILLAALTSITAYANSIESIDYLSAENFGMPALEVKTTNPNEVQVIVKGAVLKYPDSGFNPESAYNLGQAFALDGLNSLILTFPQEACVNKESDEVLTGQIITCNRYPNNNHRKVRIKGAISDFNGQITAVSETELTAVILSVEIVQARIISTSEDTSFLQARVGGTIPAQGDLENLISLNLTKSRIEPRIP
ncbi:MAG: hypothetical protein R3B45_16750 [Bdellovibrionota bacterium]